MVVRDRVLELTTTTGTGDITPGGAVTGFRSFASALTAGQQFDYVIYAADANGTPTGAWECGRGTWDGAVIQRTAVQSSSNANSPVAFAAGIKYVMLSINADALGVIGSLSGGVTLIAEVALTTPSSAVVFDDIPAIYRDLRVTGAGRSQAVVNADLLNVRFNNSTTGYSFSRSNRFGAAASNNASYIELGTVPGNNAAAGDFGAAEFTIVDYANTVRHKSLTGTNYASDAGAPVGHFHGGTWRDTAAISRMDLFAGSGNLEPGTVYRLWGFR